MRSSCSPSRSERDEEAAEHEEDVDANERPRNGPASTVTLCGTRIVSMWSTTTRSTTIPRNPSSADVPESPHPVAPRRGGERLAPVLTSAGLPRPRRSRPSRPPFKQRRVINDAKTLPSTPRAHGRVDAGRTTLRRHVGARIPRSPHRLARRFGMPRRRRRESDTYAENEQFTRTKRRAPGIAAAGRRALPRRRGDHPRRHRRRRRRLGPAGGVHVAQGAVDVVATERAAQDSTRLVRDRPRTGRRLLLAPPARTPPAPSTRRDTQPRPC